MPDLTVTCNLHGRPQQHIHHVGDLSRSTIAQVVDLFESQVGTVLSVDCDGRNLYKLRDRPPSRNTRIIS